MAQKFKPNWNEKCEKSLLRSRYQWFDEIIFEPLSIPIWSRGHGTARRE
ncbi:39831_t:CDS:1, partial [Gigaspora margarita]